MARWVVTGAAIAFIAAFIYYLFLPDPTPLVMVRASAYPIALPPLAFSLEDESLLVNVNRSNLKIQGRPIDLAAHANPLDELRKSLSQIQPSMPSRLNPFRWSSEVDLAVVYVAAHGAVNEDNQPCLIPRDGDMLDSSTWLPLEDFLAAIAGDKVKAKRKLVVLDCQRVLSSWRCGLLDNQFVQRLQSTIQELNLKDPGLFVIASSGPGQVNWPAPERRGTVFGHFFARAMAGEADADKSGNVSLLELASYLTREVDAYAQRVWGAHQTPIIVESRGRELIVEGGRLVPSEGQSRRPVPEISLVRASRNQFAERWWEGSASSFDSIGSARSLAGSSTDKPDPQKPTLFAVATRFARLRESTGNLSGPSYRRYAYVRDPIEYASFQQRLLAVQERMLAGQEYQEGLASELANLDSEMSASSGRNLPLAPTLNLLFANWAGVAAADQSAPAAIPSNRANSSLAAFQEWQSSTKPDRPKEFAFPGRTRSSVITEVLDHFMTAKSMPVEFEHRDNVSTQSLPLAFEFLEGHRKWQGKEAAQGRALQQELIEGHFIRLLAKGLEGAGTQADAISRALVARRYAEWAATPSDERAHYAIEGLVNSTDEIRRRGEDLLYLGQVAGSGGAEELLTAAAGSAGESSGYRFGLRLGNELSQSLKLRDQVWAELPALAEWYFLRERLAAQDESNSAQASSFEFAGPNLRQLVLDTVTLARSIEQATDIRFQPQASGAQERLVTAVTLARKPVQETWEALHALPDTDVDPGSGDERVFATATKLRHHWLLVQSLLLEPGIQADAMEKCLSTLASPDQVPAGSSGTGRIARNSSQDAYRKFVATYRGALTYGFTGDDFAAHLSRQEQSEISGQPLDLAFRVPLKGSAASVWQTMSRRWNEYDERKNTRFSDAASSDELRTERRERSRWDQVFRVGAFWLCDVPRVEGDRDRKTAVDAVAAPGAARGRGKSPAENLREIDWAHLVAWHAYRLRQDFWGNGELNSSGSQSPFFVEKIEQCARSLAGYPHILYVATGANVAESNSLDISPAAVASISNRFMLEGTSSASAPATAGENPATRIEIKVGADPGANAPLAFPSGTATLLVNPAENIVFLDERGKAAGQRDPVKVNPLGELSDDLHRAKMESTGVDGSQEVVTSLWYRGHVWRSDPFRVAPPSPKNYLKLVYDRQGYSTPSITVEGDAKPAGAILFVFDCSSSMRPEAGQSLEESRFFTAKSMLRGIVKLLSDEDNDQLYCGLMLYGHRTAVSSVSGEELYDYRYPFDSAQLTVQGKRRFPSVKAAIDVGVPHPDRDFEFKVPLAAEGNAQILKYLDQLTIDNCKGVTPLYAAISEALRSGFKDVPAEVTSRQVIVITDGVNFPFFQTARPDGTFQYDFDRDQLKDALKLHHETSVKVFYFGEPSDRDRARFNALVDLSKDDQTEFEVEQSAEIASIEASIKRLLPRPTLRVKSPAVDLADGAAVEFNQAWRRPNWDPIGMLLASPEPNLVEVKLPKSSRAVSKSMNLVGGEAAMLRFDAQRKELFFDTSASVGGGVPLAATVPTDGSRTLIAEQLPADKTGVRANFLRIQLLSRSAESELAQRPNRVWVKITPQDPPSDAQTQSYSIFDAQWADKAPLPRLHIPVEGQFAQCRKFHVALALRYDAPVAQERIAPGEQQRPLNLRLPDEPSATWRVQQSGGEAGIERTITITHALAQPDPTLQTLMDHAVWLMPAPDRITHSYALDGSHAVHEFVYTRPGTGGAELEIAVETAASFRKGAWIAELDAGIDP